MTNNIRKPPRENGSTSSSTQRSSLWKRLGRRGSNKPPPTPTHSPTPSNTASQQSAPSGSIPLKSSKELYETIPVEPDNGDARSLSAAKRSQRMNNNNNNNNNNTKNNTTSSKGGGGGGLMRKLKSSFRKNSANSDQNQLQLQLQQDIDDDNDGGTMLPDHQRSPLSSPRPLDPSSPAYSTDSFVTVEVGKLYIIIALHCIANCSNIFFNLFRIIFFLFF
jgi:hypothetical protein